MFHFPPVARDDKQKGRSARTHAHTHTHTHTHTQLESQRGRAQVHADVSPACTTGFKVGRTPAPCGSAPAEPRSGLVSRERCRSSGPHPRPATKSLSPPPRPSLRAVAQSLPSPPPPGAASARRARFPRAPRPPTARSHARPVVISLCHASSASPRNPAPRSPCRRRESSLFPARCASLRAPSPPPSAGPWRAGAGARRGRMRAPRLSTNPLPCRSLALHPSPALRCSPPPTLIDRQDVGVERGRSECSSRHPRSPAAAAAAARRRASNQPQSPPQPREQCRQHLENALKHHKRWTMPCHCNWEGGKPDFF